MCSPPRSLYRLRTCLEQSFPPSDERYGYFNLPQIVYPADPDFSSARRTDYGNAQPAVVVMAETADDVRNAVTCAAEAGYRISPRGRGHSYQTLSNSNGYVVIDCSLLCKPEEFVFSHEEGDWILEGQKYIGTVYSGSGCTNAVMLAATAKEFAPEEGALFATGTCPSVGITGYLLGGGSGDVTPSTGWGSDDVLELRAVIWNGTNAEYITANKEENADFFWASLGGGGGLGVITDIKTAIVQSPEPLPHEDRRKFLYIQNLEFHYFGEESKREGLESFRRFLYEKTEESHKFGGGGFLHSESFRLNGIYLGSADEFIESFGKNGLLQDIPPVLGYHTIYRKMTSEADTLEDVCDGTGPCQDWPNFHGAIIEFESYGEAMLYKLCDQVAVVMGRTQTSGDWCKDLKISPDNCVSGKYDEHFSHKLPICEKRGVLDALLEAAYDPESFFNHGGPPEWWLDLAIKDGRVPYKDTDDLPTSLGGLLIPDVDVDTLIKISDVGTGINHFQHGAPMQFSSDYNAVAHRDTAILIEFLRGEEQRNKLLEIISEHYDDGELGFQGYYNYMNPVGNPNWRKYYFGDNYERLSETKLKYDQYNFFGNVQQVEPAIPKKKKTAEKGDFDRVDSVYMRGVQG
uniref:FAD-binding PCMH-type domain-containing protein n=1 Tax=Ditylum brightwellii TaxID=49249 RepID=A0A7S4WD41_9STRA